MIARSAAIAGLLALACSASAAPTGYSYGVDMYDPQEDVVAQTDVAVDVSQGTASGMALITVSTLGGNYDITLIRNDMTSLFMILPRYGKQTCYAFNITVPSRLPHLPSNADFVNIPTVGTSSIFGRTLQHKRSDIPGGYTLGAYLDLNTGYPVFVTDTLGDGTQQYVRYVNTTQPPASLFAVPQVCMGVAALPLAQEWEEGQGGVADTIARNLDVIAKHSAKSYKLGPNRFIGIEPAVFARRYLMPSMSHADLLTHTLSAGAPTYTRSGAPLPASIDRVAEGKTTPIRDQSICGGCWTFATAAAIETNTAVSGSGALTVLAVQAILDCVPPGSGIIAAKGCNGGWPLTAMLWAASTGGVPSEASYPYTLVDGNCNTSIPHVSPLTSYASIAAGNTAEIMDAIAQHGSVTAIMQTLGDILYFTDGVYSNSACTGATLNHAVTLVGYGNDAATGMDYWLIKNSFGKAWGAGGYFRMQRGVNMCGIENWAAVPIVA